MDEYDEDEGKIPIDYSVRVESKVVNEERSKLNDSKVVEPSSFADVEVSRYIVDCRNCEYAEDLTMFMVACDNCDKWYHGICINIEENYAKRINTFYCLLCCDKNPDLKNENIKISNQRRKGKKKRKIGKYSMDEDYKPTDAEEEDVLIDESIALRLRNKKNITQKVKRQHLDLPCADSKSKLYSKTKQPKPISLRHQQRINQFLAFYGDNDLELGMPEISKKSKKIQFSAAHIECENCKNSKDEKKFMIPCVNCGVCVEINCKQADIMMMFYCNLCHGKPESQCNYPGCRFSVRNCSNYCSDCCLFKHAISHSGILSSAPSAANKNHGLYFGKKKEKQEEASLAISEIDAIKQKLESNKGMKSPKFDNELKVMFQKFLISTKQA